MTFSVYELEEAGKIKELSNGTYASAQRENTYRNS